MSLIYLLLLSSYIFSRGFYSIPSLILICVSLLSVIFVVKKKGVTEYIQNPNVVLWISILLTIGLYGGLYQNSGGPLIGSYAVLLIVGLISTLDVFNFVKIPKRSVISAIFVGAILLRIFIIRSSPSPYIDVFYFLRDGANGFLHGKNPYAMNYSPLYRGVMPDYYFYFPATLLATLPSVLLFRDPRYLFLICEILTALILVKICTGNKNKWIYACCVLFSPVSLYVLEQSYTEAWMVLLIFFASYLISRQRIVISAVIAGALVASKQYAFVLIPYLGAVIKTMRLKMLFILLVLLICSMGILPFYVWSPDDFFHDTITLQVLSPLRGDGLTVQTWLAQVGLNPTFAYIGMILGFILLGLPKRASNLSNLLCFICCALLIFFLFNKWAYINYFYLISQLFVLSWATRANK